MNSEQESVTEYEFGDSDQRCIAELLTDMHNYIVHSFL